MVCREDTPGDNQSGLRNPDRRHALPHLPIINRASHRGLIIAGHLTDDDSSAVISATNWKKADWRLFGLQDNIPRVEEVGH
jgi:hypothetical protein